MKRADIDTLADGSFEGLIFTLAEAVAAQIGEGYTPIATHQGFAYFDHPDGMVKILYDDELNVAIDPKFKLDTVNQEDVNAYAGRVIRDVVEGLVNGSDIESQLHELVGLADYAQPELFCDARDRCLKVFSESASSAWHTSYDKDTAAVRKGARGGIKQAEGMVPKERFGRVKPGSFALSDIQESLRSIQTALQALDDSATFGDCKADEGDDAAPMAVNSLLQTATSLSMAVESVIRTSTESDLQVLAGLHDRLADHVKKMVVFHEYVRRSA